MPTTRAPVLALVSLLAACGRPPWIDASPPRDTVQAIRQNVLAPERSSRLLVLAEDHARQGGRALASARDIAARIPAEAMREEVPSGALRAEVGAFRDELASAVDGLVATHVGLKALAMPGEWDGIVRLVQPDTGQLLEAPRPVRDPLLGVVDAGARVSLAGDTSIAGELLAFQALRVGQVVSEPSERAAAVSLLERMRTSLRRHEAVRTRRLAELEMRIAHVAAGRPELRPPLEALARSSRLLDTELAAAREDLRALLSASQWNALFVPDPRSLAAR
jgi:hypothetical protein